MLPSHGLVAMICWRGISSFRWLPVNLHKKHVFVGGEIFIQHFDQRGCDMYGKATVFTCTKA